MQKIAVFFLSFLTLLPAAIQPMSVPESRELGLKNAEKNSYHFIWHQPFWGFFKLVNIQSAYCEDKNLYMFRFRGSTADFRFKRRYPILGNFTLTINLIPRSHALIFVVARLHAAGFLQTFSGQAPIDLNIPFEATYRAGNNSDITSCVLDDSITQLIDAALFFERGLSKWTCSQCHRALWYDNGSVCIAKHYITKLGNLLCKKCIRSYGAKECTECSQTLAHSSEVILVDALVVPKVTLTKICNKLEHAQQYGGVW
jgi:hypothetical protein